MGDKTLWVNLSKYGNYSINIPAERPIFQVHRIQGGINFEANSIAMKKLSPKAYMLYMFLVSHSLKRIWTLSPGSIVKHTTLSENDLDAAIQELTDHGYWTTGKIDLNGQKFSCNSFHVWESPSMHSYSST